MIVALTSAYNIRIEILSRKYFMALSLPNTIRPDNLDGSSPAISSFSFRPWIRSTCRKAMFWGLGFVGVFGLTAWIFRAPGSAPLERAFGVLALYGTLFWITLLKIWWTAGRPAVLIRDEEIAYQPLHAFGYKTIPYKKIFYCAPRADTESLRIIHETRHGRGKEFFLNLAVVRGRDELLDALGRSLEDAGLEAVEEAKHTWRRDGFEDPHLQD